MIGERGAIVSEFGPGTPPMPHHFPRRNRIVAAFCDAVVVVEAKERSGALITARWANELGRDVFGVPGQVDNPAASGVLALIRDGARFVRGANDLVEDLGWEDEEPAGEAEESADDANDESKSSGKPRLTKVEAELLACLDHEGLPLDTLLQAVLRPVGDVMSTLLSLEVRGLVEALPGMAYRRTS